MHWQLITAVWPAFLETPEIEVTLWTMLELFGSQCFQIQLTCHRSTTHSIEKQILSYFAKEHFWSFREEVPKIFSWRQVPRDPLPSTIFAYPPKFFLEASPSTPTSFEYLCVSTKFPGS